MFSSVLIANRGEIAVRIVKTLRRLGIRSVVACSIPDSRSLAVRMADAHVVLEGYSAAETYLDMDAIIAAALRERCEAVHPGYGFLAERSEFALRCVDAGLVFVGPRSDVLAAVGDKAEARRLAVTNDVPVVPGWDGADDDATLQRQAELLGYPLMIKARGGGGGRGMRAILGSGELREGIESARREALATFGDPGLLLERLVTHAHHVEVQVLADSHGNVIHLGERDCSVQRRHQKLIEETPSPVVGDDLREALTAAAIRLARAVGYVNAGTFEFLVGEPAEDGRRPFFFLEVNPRLQVEHPVTEMVTGLDLVELQLRIAAGERLPIKQEDVQFSGHAIEFRINAEDPWEDFRPSAGRLRSIGVGTKRFDSGFEGGDVVPTQYDSLLAKAIVHGPDREAAIASARHDLGHCQVVGVQTNIPLHRAIASSATFAAGGATIDWLESELPVLLEEATAPRDAWLAAAVALTIGDQTTPGLRASGHTAWIGAGSSSVWLSDGARTREVRLWPSGTGMGEAAVDGERLAYRAVEDGASLAVVHLGESGHVLNASRYPEGGLHVYETVSGGHDDWTFRLAPPPALPRRVHLSGGAATAILAPLAGTVVAIQATAGDYVEAGQLVAILEAMKMEHRITAPSAGRVASVEVREQAVVREGDVLVELE
jgi:acetyl/propionyl-CoA carboxylase alpha subunit